MRLVDELPDSFAQGLEGRFLDFLLIAAGFKVTAREKPDQIRQPPTIELGSERYPQHVRVAGVVEVVVLTLQPAHSFEVIGLHESLIVVLDMRVELRRDGQVAKVVNGLAQGVAIKLLVGRDLRHDEVRLAEHHAL